MAALTIGCHQEKSFPHPHKRAEQKISINLERPPQSIDPRKVDALEEINLVKTFMDGLVRTTKEGHSAPAIAKRYDLSDDGKTYTFYLRDTKWSNGDPLKAEDFVYAWKKALSPDFSSTNASILYMIKNGKFIKENLLPSCFLGAYAKDAHTLVIQLETPIPFFIEFLSHPIFFPVHPSMDNPSFSNPYICNGPFKITDWQEDRSITATKNAFYWENHVVQLDTLEMIMVDRKTGMELFLNKQLDWSPYSMDANASLTEPNTLHTDPLLGTYWIRINPNSSLFQNESFQKALSAAINRNDLTETLPEKPFLVMPTDLNDLTDPKQAVSLFKTALNKASLSLETLPKITLTYIATSYNHKIVQTIQQQWQSLLNLPITLDPVDAKTYAYRAEKRDYQLIFGSWVADMKDPLNFLEIFKAKQLSSKGSWESLDYQKALEESYLSSVDPKEPQPIDQLENLWIRKMPLIPVFHYPILHAKQDRLKDVVLTDSGYVDFKWAYVES